MESDEDGQSIASHSYFSIMTEAQLQSLDGISESYYIPSTTSNWFSDFRTNSKYKLSTLISQELSSKQCVMLGKTYTCDREFEEDFSNVHWVTYRSSFRPILGKNDVEFYSDAGWGCTLRVSQMLLLRTLRLHLKQITNEVELLEQVQENSLGAPYSIHEMCRAGEALKRSPGQWYSPSDTAHILDSLIRGNLTENLRCKVFMDSILYRDQLIAAARGKPVEQCRYGNFDDWKFSVLVLMPLRLGFDKIQSDLFNFLKLLLKLQQCVGLIGGKNRSALYIIGYQKENFLVLDPHYVQKTCESRTDLIKNRSTYHCEAPLLHPIEDMQSSMTIGLYFKDYEKFLEFEELLETQAETVKGAMVVHRETPDFAVDALSLNEDEYFFL